MFIWNTRNGKQKDPTNKAKTQEKAKNNIPVKKTTSKRKKAKNNVPFALVIPPQKVQPTHGAKLSLLYLFGG
jgi:hypothetical protein